MGGSKTLLEPQPKDGLSPTSWARPVEFLWDHLLKVSEHPSLLLPAERPDPQSLLPAAAAACLLKQG